MKTTNEILEMVEQYKEAAQLIELAQAEQEQLKAEIKAALAERNVNYLEVGCQGSCPRPVRAVQQDRHRTAVDSQLKRKALTSATYHSTLARA